MKREFRHCLAPFFFTFLGGTNLNSSRDNQQLLEVKGLEHLTKIQLLEILNDFIKNELDFVESDFKITQIRLVGSRITKTERKDSDLDVAFEYEGKYREDTICDVLNMEPLIVEGIQIDFIPYSIYKGSSIESEEPSISLLK